MSPGQSPSCPSQRLKEDLGLKGMAPRRGERGCELAVALHSVKEGTGPEIRDSQAGDFVRENFLGRGPARLERDATAPADYPQFHR